MPERYTLAREFRNPTLEQSLLAAIATRPDVYWAVSDLLSPDVFTESRALYEALTAAILQGQPLPTIEGDPAADPSAATRELIDLFQKRLLADLGQGFLDSLRSDTPATTLIAQVEERLARVQQVVRESQTGQAIALPDLLPKVLQDIRERWQARKEGKSVGLPTGFPRVDKLLGGLQPGEHLLAAEPGQGKTTLVLQIAAYVAKAGFPVIVLSFEEALLQLTLKALCAAAQLEAKRFADGFGDPAVLERAIITYSLQFMTLYLMEGTSRVSPIQVKAKALQLMNRHGAKRCLIIVDYLQRWAATRRSPSDFRLVVSALVSELRELALGLECPVLVIRAVIICIYGSYPLCLGA
jgi:replicative DNA helicase